MRIDRLLPAFIIVFLLFFTGAVLASPSVNQTATAPSLLSAIQTQEDTLIVGSEQDYPPFAIGMTDATADGFTVDLWKAVAAETGLKYTIRVRPFHELLQEFKDGKVDVLINLAQSEGRHQFADFTIPHVIIHGAIFVRKGDSQIRSEDDFAGKSIIVLKADLAHDYAVSKGWEKQLVLVNTPEQGLRLLASGKHDALLLSKLAGMQTLRELEITTIRALDIKAGFTQKFSFAVHKGNADLLAKINEGLALTKPSGTFDTLYEKWFQPYEEKPASFLQVFWYFAPIILIILGLAGHEFYRRRIEQKRAAAQQALSARVFKEAREAIIITDANGTIIDVNPSFCNTTGYSRTEVIGQNPRLLNSGKHGPEFFTAMWTDLKGHGYWQSEMWNRKKNGEFYYEHLTISSLHDENGKIIHYVGFSSDISERKQAEESLQMMRFGVDHAGDSIFWISREGRILYANQAACEERGYSSEELLGLCIFDLDPDYPPEVWGPHFEDLKRRGTITLNTRHRIKDGVIYPIEVNANYVHIGGHEFNFCFVRNITARILMAEELKNREAKFRSIIEISPVPMALNDNQQQITYVNPAFTQTFGYRLEDIPTLTDWWPKAYPNADYREQVKATWQAALEQAQREQKPCPPGEFTICTQAGEFKTAIVNAAMIAGSTEHLIVFVDITERKKADDYEQFRNTILEQLATNKPLFNILEALVLGVEQINPTMVCSIVLLDDEGKHLLESVAPNLPDFYNQAIKGAEIGIGVGSCGTAAFTGKPIIVEDIATHPYWAPYKELAAKAGLRACWSQPILSSLNKVLGTFAIYHHETITPTAPDIYLIEQSAKLASIAIERRQNDMDLRIAATAFDSQEGIIVTDANCTILRVNGAFTAISGYTAEDVVGQNMSILQSGQAATEFYQTVWQSLSLSGSWEGEVWNRRKNGEIYPEHLIITAVKDQNGIIANYVATLTDITLRKEAVDKIEQLAFYDPLTGLPNRRLLQDRLPLAFAASHRSGRQGALLFIDMDNFKTLNDTLGHDMGDLLLQQVSQRLKSCVREGDTVARFGGDEFVVLLEDVSGQTLDTATQAEIVGNNIIAVLNQPYQLDAHEHHSTPSIGVTLFNGQEQSSEELLKQADIAMYQAKTSGRNALCFFDPQMQAIITAHVALEEDLRLALKEEQFILYYQPQVRHTGEIIGAEVLIRWQHPRRGLVSPTEFIPLAEETRLILSIGEWVLKKACAQLKRWEAHAHTRHLQLAVNVSASQFHQTDFVGQVQQILQVNAINPTQLKLELTESLVLDDIDDTILKMNALRKIGVRFSMDDFGTGYSSLSSLKKLPLDQLKIDRSFVRDISIDQDNTVIVETIIAMANKLNMQVIAEGVETEGQRAFLEQHNCLLFQGYLFSKPVPVEQFEALLKQIPH